MRARLSLNGSAHRRRRRRTASFRLPPSPSSSSSLFVYLPFLQIASPQLLHHHLFYFILLLLLSLPPPLGDYNGPAGRWVTSQHGRCFLLYFTDFTERKKTNKPKKILQISTLNVLCCVLTPSCVFLSFSKMFIGGLSWQTTQGELSRTLLYHRLDESSISMSAQ